MRTIRTVTALLLALIAFPPDAAVTAQDSVELPDKSRFHLFLLVGQSNMAGRGKVEASDQTPHPRVLTLSKEQMWVQATDPLHFDKPKIVGVGLGRTFAIELAESQPDVTIGLIPCAVGGSPIAAWQPGAYYKPTESHPWDDAVARAEVALKRGTLKGILWHQGESDSKPELAEAYEGRLHDLIARFRDELDAPSVPFLVGQMGQFPERPWNNERRQVDAAHRLLPERIDHTAFVPSHGLSHKGDEVHFDSASYRELGRRFAHAYRNLVERQQP